MFQKLALLYRRTANLSKTIRQESPPVSPSDAHHCEATASAEPASPSVTSSVHQCEATARPNSVFKSDCEATAAAAQAADPGAYLRVPVATSKMDRHGLERQLPAVLEFVSGHLAQEHRILLHCDAGNSFHPCSCNCRLHCDAVIQQCHATMRTALWAAIHACLYTPHQLVTECDELQYVSAFTHLVLLGRPGMSPLSISLLLAYSGDSCRLSGCNKSLCQSPAAAPPTQCNSPVVASDWQLFVVSSFSQLVFTLVPVVVWL